MRKASPTATANEMTSDNNSVLLTILNKSYWVNCPPEERSSLLESARYLDERMYRIQRRVSKLDREQIAVMVALNITHELLKKPAAEGGGSLLEDVRLAQLEDKLNRALGSEGTTEKPAVSRGTP